MTGKHVLPRCNVADAATENAIARLRAHQRHLRGLAPRVAPAHRGPLSVLEMRVVKLLRAKTIVPASVARTDRQSDAVYAALARDVIEAVREDAARLPAPQTGAERPRYVTMTMPPELAERIRAGLVGGTSVIPSRTPVPNPEPVPASAHAALFPRPDDATPEGEPA